MYNLELGWGILNIFGELIHGFYFDYREQAYLYAYHYGNLNDRIIVHKKDGSVKFETIITELK